MPTERGAVRRPPGRKAQIVAAADGRFHRQGYHQVSMADVAAEVGITAPALYRHFRGKPELLLQVVESGLAGVRAAVLAGSSGPVELCTALASVAIERRSLGVLWQRDARLLPPAQRAGLRRGLRADVRVMIAALRTARPELPASEAELICWSVLSAYAGLSNHTFAPPRRRFERLLGQLGADVFAVSFEGLRAGPVTPTLPPSPTQLRSAAAESRREALLVAAIRLFHERGFDNVSTDQLGAAVGIAGPSVYRHFGTKAELLAAALLRGRERLWREVGAVFAGYGSPAGAADSRVVASGVDGLRAVGDPAAALAAGLRAYVDFALRNSHYLGAMLSETERLAEPDRRAAIEFRREFLRVWVGLLQQIRPEYDDAEARIRIHAMFALVNDGVRQRPVGLGPALGECLVVLSRAVLGVGSG